MPPTAKPVMPRARIRAYFGEQSDILAVHPAASGGSLFVVDAGYRGRLLRTLGSIGKGGVVLEQSAMDLLRPERLVYVYERMMLVALALVPDAATVLLLGLGGGAMARHLMAYLPDCTLTIVERDGVVRDLARRHFYLTHPVIAADAEDVIADRRQEFDVILADLYDPAGVHSVQDNFWRDCLAALRPAGCLAINWAGFTEAKQVRDDIAHTVGLVGRSFFLAQRGARPNLVQFSGPDGRRAPADLADRVQAFARRYRLPREDRDILQSCEMLTRVSALSKIKT